jgi:hypothetical protein
MEPSLFDCAAPDIPEVSPDDVWADAAVLQSVNAALPPKRALAETPFAATGLCIDSRLPSRASIEPATRMEVCHVSGGVVRLEPEKPFPDRMPALHVKPAARDRNSMPPGEASEWGIHRKESVLWIFATGLAVAVLVVGAMMLLPLINQSNAARPHHGHGMVVSDPMDAIQGAEPLADMFTRQAEAEQIFRAFAKARVADDVLPCVRDAAAMGPLVRAHHRPLDVPADWSPPKGVRWTVFENNRRVCGLLEGNLPDFSKFRAYYVLEGARLLLDWKASVAFCTATFGELEKKEGDPTEIRGWISPADYYTIAFPEQQYQCYQLASPDRGKFIWCYGRRGGYVNSAVAGILRRTSFSEVTSRKPEKITLRLEPGPAGSPPNQWLVGELLHKDWITP